MQCRSEKTKKLAKVLGELVRKFRVETSKSGHKFSCEYDINSSHFSRLEKGLLDCKLVTFYKIAQALGLKPSQLMKILEDELGDGFSLVDE